MKSFQLLAKVAYEAFEAELAKAKELKPHPWALLPPAVQARWVVAVQKVVAELETIR